jgi:hypothetical protein
MRAIFAAVNALERLEEGEVPGASSPPPLLNLRSSHSLVSQMSWRATPLEKTSIVRAL